MSKPLLHVFPNGDVEVGSPVYVRGKGYRPSYRWTPGYSEVSSAGVSQPLPRREWYAMAKRDGQRVVFHPDREAARLALDSQN